MGKYAVGRSCAFTHVVGVFTHLYQSLENSIGAKFDCAWLEVLWRGCSGSTHLRRNTAGPSIGITVRSSGRRTGAAKLKRYAS